jgi:EAL domain-containing protein (putative c-di-GMP-specific phosphodiesterase class I)
VENVVIKNADDIISKNIHALGHLGCQIDLDDFGTGHASIPSLHHAGLNRLKIDRSFITHCDSDPKQKRLLSAMVAMAQELDLKIVTEGVETIGEQCEVIRQGADVIQGYAIARPMPGHDIPKWVEKYHSLVGHARGIG